MRGQHQVDSWHKRGISCTARPAMRMRTCIRCCWTATGKATHLMVLRMGRKLLVYTSTLPYAACACSS